MAKVSLIVAIYNTGKYLKPCLDSLIKQTFEDIEIILIDDGSSDGSEEICDFYAKKDSRVKVIHKKNEGLSMARNSGIRYATANYIIFIDGDDYIENDMVEKLYYAIEENDADIAECGVSWIYKDTNVEEVAEKLIICDNIKSLEYLLNGENFLVMACNKIYKKRLFEDIKYPKGCIHEDVGTTYKLIKEASKLVSIPYIGYNYVQRGSSISHMKFEKKHLDAIRFLEEIYICMKKINSYLSSKSYENLMMGIIYWYIKAIEDNITNEKSRAILEKKFIDNFKYIKKENISIKVKIKIKIFKLNPKLYINLKSILKNKLNMNCR